MPIHEFNYSLVIPTRNRQHTAVHAIQSAIACDYEKLQIIVSDNSDDDSLKKLIDDRGWSKRVLYHKTDRVLSMHENWAEGLDRCTGDYVAVIGDDDAIYPDALIICNAMLSKVPAQVVRNVASIYKWPDYPFPGRRNYLWVTLDSQISLVKNLHELLRNALEYKTTVGTGPGMYQGFVQRDFLETLKKKRGAWFVEHQPDMDSGYCTLMYAKSMLHIQRPLFLSGHCGASNSGAMRFGVLTESAMNKYIAETKLAHESEIVGHEGLSTVRGAIVSGQLRMLPEIRRALGNPSADIDKLGAWKFLAGGVREGYDSIGFRRDLKALQALAKEWDISDKVEPPTIRGLPASTSEYQGPPPLDESVAEGSTKAEKKTGLSLVINGEAAGLRNINDAVKYSSALLPSLLTLAGGRDTDAFAYFMSHAHKHHSGMLADAKKKINQGDWTEAEQLASKVCAENALNSDAFAVLGDARVRKGDVMGASAAYARGLSLKPTFGVVLRYVWCLCELGQLESARFMIEDIRPSATNAELKEYIRKMEALVDAKVEGKASHMQVTLTEGTWDDPSSVLR